MWCLYCIMLVSVVDGLLQVISGKYSSEFNSASSALTFASNSDELYRLETSETYSVLTWVKFQIQPTTSLPYVFLKASGAAILTLSKGIDGSLKAQAVTLSGGTVTASLIGPVAPQWTHVAAFVCSTTLTLVVTPWQGTTISTVQTSAETFKSYDSATSALILGGTPGSMMIVKSIQGQLLDTKFDTVCVTLGDIAAIVGSAVCHSQCATGCSGPGDKSCNEYIQLMEEAKPKSVNRDIISWTSSDPHLQGKSLVSSDYAFTGWYFLSTSTVYTASMFRLENVYASCCATGNRVMVIFYFGATIGARVDTVSIANRTPTAMSFPVCST